MYYLEEGMQKLYISQMEYLKRMNAEYIALKNGREYRCGRELMLLKNRIKNKEYIKLFQLYERKKCLKRAQKIEGQFSVRERGEPAEMKNYFSDERVAIYTCITGSYDGVIEPVCRPDNCDYYLVTDEKKELPGSVWKQIIINKEKYGLSAMSNADVNRFFKMHADILFPQYRYSVYIDGNIKVISDLTEFVNQISRYGIAVHLHGKRDCVYEEAKVILALKKDTQENIGRHINYLKEQGMPAHYGLLECNIIAREHKLPICKKLMDDWWTDFQTLSKRDQLALPSVLFRNKIRVESIATLGIGVENDYAVRVESHLS